MSEIEVGDRVTFENKYRRLITESSEIGSWKNENIIKIERIGSNGWYTVYEKEKELLTEEEREFLKQYIKMSSLEITHISKENEPYEHCVLRLINGKTAHWTYFKENYFKGLEIDKEYDLSELSLEKEYCECCGVEITKENKALDNMCNECKYGLED